LFVREEEGDLPEARRLYEATLNTARKLDDKRLIADVLKDLGYLALETGDYAQAAAYGEEAFRLSQEEGDLPGMADSSRVRAGAARDSGDYARANQLFIEGMDLVRRSGNRFHIAYQWHAWGELALLEGNPAALARQEESLAIFRASDNRIGIAYALLNLGYAAQQAGDIPRMTATFAESLELFVLRGIKWAIAACVAGLAGVAAEQARQHTHTGSAAQVERRVVRAARLFGAAAALTAEAGGVMYHAHGVLAQRNEALARAHLDEAAWEAAWTAGRAMSLEQAIAEALSVTDGAEAIA
jgi:hypothetical protein